MSRVFIKPERPAVWDGNNPAATRVKSEGAYRQVSTDTLRETREQLAKARQIERERRGRAKASTKKVRGKKGGTAR